MSKINICAFIAKNANGQEQTINNIVNEIEMVEGKKLSLVIVTIINGIEFDKSNIYLDYFIRYVCDFEQKCEKRPFTHLFSSTTQKSKIKKREGEGNLEFKMLYENTFFDTSYDEIEIGFPKKGFYELEVFENEENISGDWRKRYGQYGKVDKKPVSVYGFAVK